MRERVPVSKSFSSVAFTRTRTASGLILRSQANAVWARCRFGLEPLRRAEFNNDGRIVFSQSCPTSTRHDVPSGLMDAQCTIGTTESDGNAADVVSSVGEEDAWNSLLQATQVVILTTAD